MVSLAHTFQALTYRHVKRYKILRSILATKRDSQYICVMTLYRALPADQVGFRNDREGV